MKQLTVYINEKANFLVKKHLKAQTFDMTKRGCKEWLSNKLGIDPDGWNKKINGWEDSHEELNWEEMSQKDIKEIQYEYNNLFAYNGRFLKAQLTDNAYKNHYLLEFLFQDDHFGGPRVFMKMEYTGEEHKLTLKESALEP